MPSIRGISAVVSPPSKAYVHDPWLLSYYRDLVEPFGATVDEDLLRSGPNVSHLDLVTHLLEGTDVAEAVSRCRPGLVVLAYALPDVHPFTAVAPHLNTLFGGEATSFGISQQGLAGPFTALRIVAAFQRSGRCREAVVAVLEQTTLPTAHALLRKGPLVDSGVLLLLDTEDSGGPALSAVEAWESREGLVERLGELAAPVDSKTLLVLGPWVDRTGLDSDIPRYDIPAGTYCTSVWLALARHWRSWQRTYDVVALCDTDPLTGTSHLAVMTQRSSGPRGKRMGRCGSAST
jgi:hypothetical protein